MIDQKLYTPVLQYTILLVITLAFSSFELNAQIRLIFPTNSNLYQDSYRLPDGTIRMIGVEKERYAGLFYVDRLPSGVITDPVFYPGAIGDQYFNFAGTQCQALPLKDGSAILAINQIACDYPPPAGICISDLNGKVLWADYLEEYGLESFIEKLALVDETVFCIIEEAGGRLYFDTAGQYVEPQVQYTIYDQVVNAPTGYFASQGPWMFSMDDQFEKLDSVLLEEPIIAICPVLDTAVLISTPGAVFLLNDDLTEAAHSESFDLINLVAVSEESIWLSRVDGAEIYSLRNDLTIRDTFEIPVDISVKKLQVVNDTIILVGNYTGGAGLVMFFHSSPADAFSFEVVKDIRIDTIALSQKVWYSPEPFSFGGFNISYDSVVVGINNSGLDTIQTINIHYKEDTGCGMCEGGHIQWSFDSLMLLPGQQHNLVIGGFSVWCRQTNVYELCLLAAPADSLPETDHLNNRLCVEVNPTLVGLDDPIISKVKVYPNPASDMIYFNVDPLGLDNMICTIFDATGNSVDQFKEINHGYSLKGYAPGIYLLMVTDQEGIVGYQRIVKVNQ